MTLNIEVVRVACNTATGTQDITFGSFGTAKAALFICSVGTVDGTAASDFNMSIGAATGTSNEWCMSLNSEDGQGSTDNQATTDSDRCVRINVAGTNTIDGDAEFTAIITDGVRITWLTAPSAAWLLTVVLFGGTDLSVHANNAALGNSVDNVVDITDPGFEPNLVITVCEDALGMDANRAALFPSFGLVHNNGSITQRAAAYVYTQGAATAHADGRATATYGIMGTSSGALVWGGEFSDFDASGFSVTTRIAGSGGTSLMYLALSIGGAFNSWVGTVDTPTSTGNDSEAGPGFQPQFVYQIGTQMEAIDTAYDNSALAGTFGFSTFTDTDEFMTSVQTEEGVGTTNTQSISDNQAVQLPDDDGTTGVEATLVSMDAIGFTLNYGAVKANAKKLFSLAVGEPTDILTQHRRHLMFGPF